MPQASIPAVFMRGGTSKGVFVRAPDLPPAGPERDALVLELLGSPDPMQIDGLGGGISSTSKLMAVAPSTEPGCDVDYLFAQASIEHAAVDYRGNCGNLTSAVGAYAIDEGLVHAQEPVTPVVLHNTNTGVRVRARVPVRDGRAAVQGEHRIAGVPRPGACITNEYLEPAGSVFGTLLPTGAALDRLDTDAGPVDASIVDVGNPVVFVRAADVGLRGDELPADVNARPELVARLERVRGSAAVRLGLAEHPDEAARTSAQLPLLALVAPPASYRTVSDEPIARDDIDVLVRALSVQKLHHAYPMTALLCTAAAAHVPDTIVHEVCRPAEARTVRVGHPKGVADAHPDVDPAGPHVTSVAVTRTARRLMAGEVYYRLPVPDATNATPAAQEVRE
ncbi:hypothetical protein ER308_13690 [Egibacter rhizosphaerae]|uniref:3-methylitaconate isomerase n=1 Tax=Egibacter rhizosphaerae TaxID=1670831 RepID=A0A411YHF8_9ACTN|nr:PrpF domain-containing protein [Egibacter rhizosphaerae]QBI20512.1 hypothetical protein ER308_13690 [Egibacter rhizosphaerae]